MQKGKRFFHILATFLAILPIASCKMDGGDIKTATKEEWQHSGSTLIIRTNVSAEGQTATNARSAVPSQFSDIDGKPLVFAGALYANGTQEKDKTFQQGECNDGRLTLAFEIVNEKEKDKEYTLEIRAYKGGTKPEFFKDISPLLSGTVPITISANASEINAPAVKLKPFEGTTEKGSIKLELLIPSEYVMFVHKGEFYPSIEPDEQENGYKKWTISADGIDAGIYEFDFLLYNSTETSVVYLWNEAINIYPGMTTDKWNSGNVNKDGARQIDKVRIFSTFYVKGENPQSDWFKKLSDSDTEENGSLSHPYTKIQDAIDRIREINDGSTPFSIYIDGTLTQNEAPSDNKKGMADFSALEKNLNLTIKSLSDTKATLDANKQSRVIYANPTSGILNLTLENLVITGGNDSGEGGGISFNSNGGTLEIKNSTISKNTVPRGGGGVHINGSSTFIMNGCTISENTANGDNIGNGAGIYIKDGVKATISNTTFSKNEANPNGGAIYAGNNCNLTTENCTISGNSAQQNGGGVYVSGGTFEMKGGTIGGTLGTDKNTAKLGGGVYVDSNGKFIMNNGTTTECSIIGNTAKNGGGGVFISGSTFEMNGGKIDGGNTEENGGGVYVYAGGTFTMSGGNIGGNTASQDGGGVYVTGGKFTMTGGSTIGGENAEDGNNAKYGGGVYITGNGTFIMNYGKISSNKAEGEADSGGGGVNVFSGKFEMKDGTISKNEANGSEFGGGGVYVHTGQEFTMRGGTISGNAANHDGGGIYSKNGNFTMSGGKIVDKNTAKYGGGVYVMAGANTFMMSNGEISNNEASERGGGVYVNSSIFSMSGTAKISGNKADKSGGGIYIYKDPTATTDAIFAMACGDKGEISGNMAQNGDGGGIYNQGGTPTIYSGTISNNEAKGGIYGGGGVYTQGGTFTMEDGTISNCTAKSGGGVYVAGVATIFTMSGGTISGNIATANGGGVYTQGGAFTMKDGTIGGNKAESGNGGGVCVYGSSTFEMIGGGINMNTAEKGNGVYVTKDNTVMNANFKKFTIGGGAKFNKKDDVYLEVQNPSPGVSLQRIHIISPLGEDFFVTITPERYEPDKPVLSANDATIMQNNYSKFAVTSQTNNDNTKTKWKIEQGTDTYTKYGVLKKDNVSTGDGISVTLPDLGTYTFVVKSNGTPIADNDKITSGNDIIFEEVTDSKGNPPDAKKFTIEIQDTSGGTICSREGNVLSVTVNVPPYPFDMEAQVYVKVVLKNDIVIEKTIPVTIGS